MVCSLDSSQSDPKARTRFTHAANEKAVTVLRGVNRDDGHGLFRLRFISFPGTSEWLTLFLPMCHLRLPTPNNLFQTAIYHHFGLPLLCFAAIYLYKCGHGSAEEIPLAAHMVRCIERYKNGATLQGPPQGDHIYPCAMDNDGGYVIKWSSLLHRLAHLVDVRRRNWAAIHHRAWRTLSQATGLRGGVPAPKIVWQI
eukprot:SM000079S22508  [mRNA]  locus=s79:537208:538169:- [translate_table: standard]